MLEMYLCGVEVGWECCCEEGWNSDGVSSFILEEHGTISVNYGGGSFVAEEKSFSTVFWVPVKGREVFFMAAQYMGGACVIIHSVLMAGVT